jgi:hypothetical protein
MRSTTINIKFHKITFGLTANTQINRQIVFIRIINTEPTCEPSASEDKKYIDSIINTSTVGNKS